MNQMVNDGLVFLIGMIFGIIMENITQILINRRSFNGENPSSKEMRLKKVFWAMINGLIWWELFRINGMNIQTVGSMFLISIGMMLSSVDLKIRRLPNELILLILLVGGSFLAIGWPAGHFGMNIAGLVIGFVIFIFPAFIGRGAGLGDVKYAAAVGFCLGLNGLISAIVVMSVAVVLYSLVFIIRKKGDLKKKIALGPFMTLGFGLVLVLNLMG